MSETRWLSETDRKRAAIMGLMGAVLVKLTYLRESGFEPYAVMMPSELNPGVYDGPDATPLPAMFIGLPVVWGDRVALLVEVSR